MTKSKFLIVFDGTLYDVVEQSCLQDYFETWKLNESDIIKQPISGEWISFSDEELAINQAQEWDEQL